MAAAGHGVNERTLPPATVDKQKVISLPQTQHPIMLHVCLIYMCVLCDKDGIKCLCIHMCSLLLFCARFGRDATERTTRVPFLPYSLRISFFIFTILLTFMLDVHSLLSLSIRLRTTRTVSKNAIGSEEKGPTPQYI